jgi:hypothetical protein
MTTLPPRSKALVLRALKVYARHLSNRKRKAERHVVWIPPRLKGKDIAKRRAASRDAALEAQRRVQEINRTYAVMKALNRSR